MGSQRFMHRPMITNVMQHFGRLETSHARGMTNSSYGVDRYEASFAEHHLRPMTGYTHDACFIASFKIVYSCSKAKYIS